MPRDALAEAESLAAEVLDAGATNNARLLEETAESFAAEVLVAADELRKDGKVSLVELHAFLGDGTEGEHFAEFRKYGAKYFRACAVDNNGKASYEELQGAVAAYVQAVAGREAQVPDASTAVASSSSHRREYHGSTGVEDPIRHVSRNAMPGGMGDKPIADEDHRTYAARMWNRMDRDGNGSLTRYELDCDEFRTCIRSVLVPASSASTGGAAYARTQMNAAQAIGYCLRKADLNHDGRLTFEEFESFLRCLRQEHLAPHTAFIIFSLFDLDGDHCIDEHEFNEIYRFYCGHHPTFEEFQAEWLQLNVCLTGKVTIDDYTRWLSTSQNPVFRQHAPEVANRPYSSGGDGQNWTKGAISSAMVTQSTHVPSSASSVGRGTGANTTQASNFGVGAPDPSWEGLSDRQLRQKMGAAYSGAVGKPRFNNKCCKASMNDVMPKATRTYFSRPHSLPELGVHYETHKGFSKHRRNGATMVEPKRRSPVLQPTLQSFLPHRFIPAGSMTNKSGKVVEWKDEYQVPVYLKPRYKPAVLDMQHPGPPPRWMTHYKEDADTHPSELPMCNC